MSNPNNSAQKNKALKALSYVVQYGNENDALKNKIAAVVLKENPTIKDLTILIWGCKKVI